MYSLDINFINDRPEFKQDKGVRSSKKSTPLGKSVPLYIGAATGLLLPALAGVALLILQNQTAQMEMKISAIEAELSRLSAQEQQNQKIQSEANQVKAEAQALATVFNQVRPWSATLQELRDRVPVGVQISDIKQIAAPTAGKSQPAQNAATPNSAGAIEISGIARSFNDVNDFLLGLQQSPFFKPLETKIVTAELDDSDKTMVVPVSQSNAVLQLKPTQPVKYTIYSSLSDAQASELLRELERKGTLGLVTRIRTLQQKGIIQQ